MPSSSATDEPRDGIAEGKNDTGDQMHGTGSAKVSCGIFCLRESVCACGGFSQAADTFKHYLKTLAKDQYLSDLSPSAGK